MQTPPPQHVGKGVQIIFTEIPNAGSYEYFRG